MLLPAKCPLPVPSHGETAKSRHTEKAIYRFFLVAPSRQTFGDATPPNPYWSPALHAPQPLSGTGGQPTPSLKAEHSGEHNQELRQTSHTACRSQSSLLLTKIEREAKRSPEYTNERRWMINGESSGSKSATISANRRFGGKAECKPCHLSVLCKWHTCKTLPLQKLSDY